MKVNQSHLEKLLHKFVKNSDNNERLNFRKVTFLCNPIQVISKMYQHLHLKRELQIDIRQNDIQTTEEDIKLVEGLKKSNIKILT